MSVSVLGFLFPVMQTSAYRSADGTQVPRDDYDEFKRAYKAKCDSDKHSVMLAASALVAVAGEPESELEASQIDAIAPVVNAGRSSSARAQTGEPIEQAARAFATGRLQEEIASIWASKQEKPFCRWSSGRNHRVGAPSGRPAGGERNEIAAKLCFQIGAAERK